MPAWPPIADGSKRYDLSHLDPFTVAIDIDGGHVRVHVDFSPHVFSDEKAKGVRIPFTHEVRFFCSTRYSASFEAAHFMRNAFLGGHVRTFRSYKKKQQFYTMDAGHIAIFMTIQKAADAEDEIKCRVVSAYVPTWSRNRLPQGKLYAVRTVLRRRLKGQPIPV